VSVSDPASLQRADLPEDMARTKDYQHFCPVARSLEVIGEKWSLLVVRDLLRGPQRFTDLMRYMGGITPKWLTQRLRDLEAAGIVERDEQPGRREVWYRLTQKGRDLAPVVESLVVWGLDHAMRPPRPQEAVFPESVLSVVTIALNRRRIRPATRVTWRFAFDDRPVLVAFDGERWRSLDDDDRSADLEINGSARDWVAFASTPVDERRELPAEIELRGARARAEEFRRIFTRRRRRTAQRVAEAETPA
jgi:DNA-binding HxlR family transcriptional regulator